MKTTTENKFDTLVANDELNKSNIVIPINYDDDDDDDMEEFIDTVCDELFDMA